MRCPRCRRTAPEGDRFCGACGSPLREEADSGRAAGPPSGKETPPRGSPTTSAPTVRPTGPPLETLAPGSVVAERYRIESVRGRGGFGIVYRASDERLDREIALKVLPGGGDTERFRRETRALAALNHPGIVTIFDAGMTDAAAWIAMEYVDGESLEERLRRDALPWDELVKAFLEVSGALHHAHRRGILHRDIKPGNVLLSSSGAVKLGDFGIARLAGTAPITEGGIVLGTMEYVAPEILSESPAGPATDIYSLGVCLYQGLTGGLPISGETPAQLVHNVLHVQPAAVSQCCPDLPSGLHRLIDACLDKSPDRRPVNARQMQLELHRIVEPGGGGGLGHYGVTVPARLSAEILTPEVEGERKRVVLMAVRERHIAELLEELPMGEIRDLRASYMENVLALIEKYRGLMEQVDRDEFLVLFGLPHASEGDGERAVACAAEMRDHISSFPSKTGNDLHFSIGLQSGHVFSTRGSSRYLVEGAAARQVRALAEAASDGEVVVGGDLPTTTTTNFEFQALPEVQLPDRERPTRPWKLGRAVQREPLLLEPTTEKLVGRLAELAYLQAAATRAREGQGQIVCLTGDAGIGKTRLMSAFVQEAGRRERDRFTVLAFEGKATRTSLPYDAAAGLVRALLGVGAGTLDPDATERLDLDWEEGQVLRSILQMEEGKKTDTEEIGEYHQVLVRVARKLLQAPCEEGPVVLVLEDLQWFDERSLDLVRELLADIQAMPLLVLATYRTGFRAGLSGHRNHHAVNLGPLTPDEERELARNSLGTREVDDDLQELLHRRSEGNPLFLLEVLRILLENRGLERTGRRALLTGDPAALDVPSSVEGIVNARVARLDPDTRKFLQLAAVVGREASVPLLDALWKDEEDTAPHLRTLTLRGILHQGHGPEGTFYRFDHALTREAVYESIVLRTRRACHRQVAEALETLQDDPGSQNLDLVAHHWIESDDQERAVVALRAAADRNQSRYRNDAALVQYDKALDLANETTEDRFFLLQGRALLLARLGRNNEAYSDAKEALSLAAGDPEKISAAQQALGTAIRHQGGFEQGLDHFRAASEAAAPGSYAKARALLDVAEILNRLCRTDEALKTLREAGRHVGLSGDRKLQCALHGHLATAYYNMGDRERFFAERKRQLAIARKLGLTADLTVGLYGLGLGLINAGRYPEALENLEESYEIARSKGQDSRQVIVLYAMAYAGIQTGDLVTAGERLLEAETQASRLAVDQDRSILMLGRGLLAGQQARYGEALDALERARRMKVEFGDTRGVIDCDIESARLYVRIGRAERAMRLIEEVLAEAEQSEDKFQVCEADTVRASALRQLGDAAGAERAAAKALKFARPLEEPEMTVPALIELGAADEGPEGLAALEDALEIARGCGRRLDVARALLFRGARLLEGREFEAGARDGREAASLAGESGARALEWRGERLLWMALSAAGDTRGAEEARSRCQAGIEAVAAGIPDPDLARSYLDMPRCADVLRASVAGHLDHES